MPESTTLDPLQTDLSTARFFAYDETAAVAKPIWMITDTSQREVRPRKSDDELRLIILDLVRGAPGTRISEIAEELRIGLAHAVELVRDLKSRGHLASDA